jgi:hypothetical protein
MVTTGISVIIGIILVNIVQPGKDISAGEKHSAFSYTIATENNRTVTLTNATWDKTNYNEKYLLVLQDQKVQGTIELISENSVTVRLWESQLLEDVVYITAEDGTRLPFLQVDGQLVSAEPELAPSGTGVEITLSIAQRLRGKEEKDIVNTLEEVLIGNRETGKEGLIPRNIFNAMVNTDILPLIFFAILIGATLSVLGERGRATINVISTLNDAVMRLVNWIMIVAPIGIFGLISARIGNAGGFSGFLPELLALGKYSFTVLFGLAIHAFIMLPLILLLFGRRNPLRYVTGVGAALLNSLQRLVLQHCH